MASCHRCRAAVATQQPAPGSCPGGSRAIDNKSAIASTASPPEPDACTQTQTLPHARPRAQTLSRRHASTRALQASLHAMSHKRADAYVVARRVERLVTRPAAGNAHGLKRALLRARGRTRCRTRGLARKRPSGHTRGDTRNTRPRTRSVSSVLTHAASLLKVRRTVAHTAGHRQRTRPESRTLSCVLTHPLLHARPRAIAQASTHAQAFATRAPARSVPRASRHMRHWHRFSKSSARWQTRQATSNARFLDRALLRVHRRKPCRTRGLARECPRRRVHHTPSHAVSHERADSCSVAFRVERTVARAADHRQRTRPESRTLACLRTQCCRSRGLARERSRGHVCAGAHITLPRTRCLGNVRTHALSLSKSDARWLT